MRSALVVVGDAFVVPDMSWCKVSSLTAAVAESLKGVPFPATKIMIAKGTERLFVDGWEIGYFLAEALSKNRYSDLRELMSDIEIWAERQG
jgi:hypothetical protein